MDTLTQHVGVSFTSVTVDYVKEKEHQTRWTNSQHFRTFPTGYIMKVNLYNYKSLSRLDFELTPIKVQANDNLKWPTSFTMTVTMLNQAGNHSHYQITKDLYVKKNNYNDEIRISYKKIDDPPPGVNYIVNDHVKFQIIVIEKY